MEDIDRTLTKYGSIHKIGEVTDQFGVKRTTFVANVSFKSLELPSITLPFALESLNTQNPNVLISPSIPLTAGSLRVEFKVECDETYACLGWKKYTLFMQLGGCEKENTQFMEIMVLSECPCLSPDAECCSDHEYNLREISSTPQAIFNHTHNFYVQDAPGIITVKFTVIDFSEGVLKPLGIIKLIAYRNCALVLEPFTSDLETRPYDLLITCKDGEKVAAHMSILMARSPFLNETLSKLENNSSESITEWIDGETSTFSMKVVLHFIYSGNLQTDWVKDPDGVVSAAKKYRLDELLQMFEHLIVPFCNRQNFQEMFALTQKYGLVYARDGIEKAFLRGNHY